MTSRLWRKISNMAVWGELRFSGIPSSPKSTISICIVIDVTSFINNAIWLDEMDRFVYKIPRREQKLFGYTIKNEYVFWYFIFSIMSLQVCFYQAFHRTFAFMCIYIHKKEWGCKTHSRLIYKVTLWKSVIWVLILDWEKEGTEIEYFGMKVFHD